MNTISCKTIDMSQFGKQTSCKVTVIHIKIVDIKARAEEMIQAITNLSWIDKLEKSVLQTGYRAAARKTVTKLERNIFSKVSNKVTVQFGEYMISDVAQVSLEKHSRHDRVPLAELWKEKISNNMGFDFHTENGSLKLITFGESKYSGRKSPYKKAISQVKEFIKDQKDEAELVHLINFVSEQATINAESGQKAFAIAFSLNSSNPNKLFNQLLKSSEIDDLLNFPELFVIGVQV